MVVAAGEAVVVTRIVHIAAHVAAAAEDVAAAAEDVEGQ